MNLNLTRFAHDTLGHYTGGTIAGLIGLLLAQSPHLAAMLPAHNWALVVCFGAAVGREAYNAATGGKFDMADISATMLGGAAIAAAAALT